MTSASSALVQPRLDSDVERLGRGERPDGAEVVVDDLEDRTGPNVAAEEDVGGAAHVLEVRLDDGKTRGEVDGAADHESQRCGLGAHGLSRDGGIDEGDAPAELGLARILATFPTVRILSVSTVPHSVMTFGGGPGILVPQRLLRRRQVRLFWDQDRRLSRYPGRARRRRIFHPSSFCIPPLREIRDSGVVLLAPGHTLR